MDNPILQEHHVETQNFASLPFVRLIAVLIGLIPSLLFAAVDSSKIIAYEQKISTHTSRADSLKQKIAEGRQKIEELKQREVTNMQKFRALDTSIALTNALLTELNSSADSLQKDMDLARTAADSIGVELDNRRKIMEERLRQIYKTGKINLPSIIFGSSSPTEMIHRVRYAQDLNKYDRKILERIEDDQQRRNTEVAILKIQRQYFTDLMEEKAKEYAELQEQVGKRKLLIAEIQTEKEQWEAEVAKMNEAKEKLNDLVLDLIQKRDDENAKLQKALNFSFKKRKGQMLWPVTGDIISPYGKQIHPIHKTQITNKGIGIAAVSGTNVKAVAPGIVEYTGKLPGYGRVLIINHYGGYMTIYAHLGKIVPKKGSEIEAGSPLGTVGESTSLEGSTLHFEIRSGAKTENPLDWLSNRSL